MPTSKTVKKICMEAFQLAAFSAPVFVTGQRLATKECANLAECPPTDDPTAYWLFISAIIAYVAGITLLVWIPAKLFITWKKLYSPYEGLWFPGNVLYIVFSYIPCVVAVLVGHEVCSKQNICFNFFRGAPMETMIIMMVVTDWSEKIRYIKLRGSDDTVRTKKYAYADLDGRKRSSGLDFTASNADGIIATTSRRSSISQRSLLYSNRRNGKFRHRLASNLKWTDARPENLLRDLMLAYDTRLLIGLSLLDGGGPSFIFQTAWVYPIYILSALSLIPLIFSPNSAIRSSMTVIFQDIPFFIFRLAILSSFGSELVLETSMLFLLKNFFATFAFLYFNVVLPWRNLKNRSQEYELNQLDRDNATMKTIGQNHSVGHTATNNAYIDENRNGHALHGIANPGYHSRPYGEDEHRDRHYSMREVNEPQYDDDDREFFDYHAEPYDDELYPTHRRMERTESHIARVERTLPPEYPTYHEQKQQSSAAVARLDQSRESKKSLQPRPEIPPKPKVINYDTLHDPNSFLYSKNPRTSERMSTRPKAVDIDFGDTQVHTSSNDVGQATSPPLPTTSKDPQFQKEPAVGAAESQQIISMPTSPATGSQRESFSRHVVGGTSSAPEPTYSAINRNRQEGRRKAPPPPTSRPPPPPESKEMLPLPHPDLLKDNQNEETPGNVLTRNQESIYTKTVARQLANEALGRRSRKEEEEAIDALNDAVQHGTKMINSQSTTPKSTISAPLTSGPPVNDEEYDNRL